MKRRQFLSGMAALASCIPAQEAAAIPRVLLLSGKHSILPLALPGNAGNPVALYSSIRATNYTGPWARVIRASDSAQKDIGFSGNIPDMVALLAFQGTSTLTVAKWYDQSGNGNHATSGASPPAVYSPNAINGILPITIGAPTVGTLLTIPSSVSLSSQACSVFRVVNSMASFANASFFEAGSSAPNTYDLLMEGTQGVTFGISTFDQNAFINTPVVNSPRAQLGVLGVVGGASSTLFFADAKTVTLGAPTLRSMTGGQIGKFISNNSFPGTFDDFCCVVYGTSLSGTIAQSVQNNLISSFSAADTGIRNLVLDGDSIQWGTNASNLVNCCRQIIPLVQSSLSVFNMGVPAQTLATQTIGYASKIAPLYNVAKSRNIVFQEAGTNDLVAGTTAAALETLIQSYCASARATGYKIVLCTILPRIEFVSGAPNTNWIAYNTWLRANWPTFADALSDRQANATMGPITAITNTTYYGADEVHPTTAGYGVLAPIDAAAINSVL